MSLVTQLQNLATRIATETKSLRTMINGNVADLSALTTTSKSNLVSAINEVYASVGGPIGLDDLTDVDLTSEAAGDFLVYDGSEWANGSFADAADARIAAAEINDLADVVITALAAGQALVFDGTNWVNDDVAGSTPDASTTVKGIVELATDAEAITGTDTVRAVTPHALDAALDDRVVAASTTVSGIVELATTGEANTGTDSVRAVTPAGLAAFFTGHLDTDGALAANSDLVAPSQKAVKTYTDALIGAANALVYKGATDCSGNPNYPAADAGWLYLVSVAGKIGGASGVAVEAGDMFVCLADSTASGNQATVGASWNVINRNVDGAVIGPASATDSNFAQFDGTTGKLIKGGLSLDTDGALAANSATRVPSQSAVVTYAQPKDATLTALAGLATGANKLAYSTGTDTFSQTDFTSFGRSLVDDADAAAGRTTLDVYSKTEIGDPTTDFVATFEAGL